MTEPPTPKHLQAASAVATTSRGSDRWLVRLGWASFGFTVATGVAALCLFALNRGANVPATWGTDGGYRNTAADLVNIVGQMLIPLIATFLGALVLARQPRQRMGWLLIATGLSSGLQSFLGELTVYTSFTTSVADPRAAYIAWIQNWIWVVAFGMLMYTLAVFPSGHFLSRFWAWLNVVCLALFVAPMLLAGMIEPAMSSAYSIANPLAGSASATVYTSLFSLALPFMPITLLVILTEIGVRFHRAEVIQRQQLKWVLASIAAMAFVVVTVMLLTFGLGLTFGAIGAVLINLSVGLPLLGIGIGVLRYRLFDIDLIIRRTLVYAVLTASLLLVYFGVIVLLQGLFAELTSQGSPLAIVISTLAIAALFSPVRRASQEMIDRRFYRQKVDARQTLAEFARTARDETDLDALTGELVQVVQETMQPEHVSVWLRR